MRNDYRVSGKKRRIRVKPLLEVRCVRYPLDPVVQLAQTSNGFLRSRLSDAVVTVEEEVVPRVLRSNSFVVDDRELTNPRQNKVLQDRSRCCRSRDDQDS